MKEFTIEKNINGSEWIIFEDLNWLGEEIKIEITRIETNLNNKSCLMYQWVKEGYIKDILPNWWHITVYATSMHDGSCWGKYNPQTKINNEGRHVINFEYMLPATEENKLRLINEVAKKAYLFKD